MGEKQKSIRDILWENVRELMLEHYGEENLARLARETKVGVATVQRIKDANTSVGIDVVEKIAKRYSREAYQMLCANAQKEGVAALIRAYNSADETGREFLVATAETVMRRRDKPSKQAGSGNR
jgi:hypothetical protein